MPPKKQQGKTDQKKKAKVVEDKTFGMKNKNKSTKVQKQIQSMKGSMGIGSNEFANKQKKKEELERKKMEDLMLKPTGIVQKKIDKGVDPKSVLCEFFKLGQCTKGSKCKFSHDLAVERKPAKISTHVDPRDAKEEETMENWDENQLRDVVEKKRSATNKNLKTEIICKYFIQALEDSKYGWRWECPNGESCIYRHCVPEDFILPSQRKKMEREAEDGPPLEDVLEEKKAQITTKTPMTKEIFLEWWGRKQMKKELDEKKKTEERQKNIKSGKILKSGREFFMENQEKYQDEEGLSHFDLSQFRKDEDDGPVYMLEASATSISSRNISNKEAGPAIQFKEEEDEPVSNRNEAPQVDESLFVEEDIPELPDE